MKVVITDGGRLEAGFKGKVGDCVCRAIAIADKRPYKEVYNELRKLMGKGNSPRNGVPKFIINHYLASCGWKWHSCSHIGDKNKIHLTEEDLPLGTLIVKLSKHLCCVKDHVIYDSFDPTREGRRMVYGYWSK